LGAFPNQFLLDPQLIFQTNIHFNFESKMFSPKRLGTSCLFLISGEKLMNKVCFSIQNMEQWSLFIHLIYTS